MGFFHLVIVVLCLLCENSLYYIFFFLSVLNYGALFVSVINIINIQVSQNSVYVEQSQVPWIKNYQINRTYLYTKSAKRFLLFEQNYCRRGFLLIEFLSRKDLMSSFNLLFFASQKKNVFSATVLAMTSVSLLPNRKTPITFIP